MTAASGADGLAKIESEHPDLVLLDVMMPGMNGYEVCQKIRANPATGMLPVVMVTALDRRNASRASRPALTIFCRNPSINLSCWRGCAPYCG